MKIVDCDVSHLCSPLLSRRGRSQLLWPNLTSLNKTSTVTWLQIHAHSTQASTELSLEKLSCLHRGDTPFAGIAIEPQRTMISVKRSRNYFMRVLAETSSLEWWLLASALQSHPCRSFWWDTSTHQNDECILAVLKGRHGRWNYVVINHVFSRELSDGCIHRSQHFTGGIYG
jgi:hypothetical protein